MYEMRLLLMLISGFSAIIFLVGLIEDIVRIIRDDDPPTRKIIAMHFLIMAISFPATFFLADIHQYDGPERLSKILIESLQDRNEIRGEIKGGMFITQGKIGMEDVFSFYEKRKDGSFQLEKVPAERCRIKYRDDIPPMMVSITRPIITEFCGVASSNDESVTYVFYIPKGSIENKYSLDGK